MIKQGLYNDSILEKKFKILRMSIILGNVDNREEMLANYEDTAKEIDKIRRGLYEEKVASKMYTTVTLEEEEKRLSELTNIIETRINERNEFIDDYIKVTSSYLDDLPRVNEEDDLTEYRMRLDNIHEFLSNCKEIESLNRRLTELRDQLQEKYENKANSEIINSKLEVELIDEFNKYIANDSYYAGLNYTDFDEELLKIDRVLKDKYDVMNTFISSYEALKNAGISGAEREEYLSYVKDSKVDFYNELEKKYILNIYKLVLDKESDYNRLYDKRLNIDNILVERNNKRQELDINTRDDLSYFIALCQEQFSIIKSQKYNIDDIDKLIVSISECENRLEEIEVANQRKEIVDLTNEFSQEVPDTVKIELPNEEKIKDEKIELAHENMEKKAPNLVVKISEPVKINVRNATDTAKLVMKKVVIVLEPKKFNNKRDKIKEAEEALKKEKELANQEKDTLTTDEEQIFIDVNKEEHEPVNIELDKESEDNTKDYLEELKINLGNNEDKVIPTEIFIDEPPVEKPLKLFSETDPFLDDNMFEVDNNKKKEEIINGMPVVDNIGTVKPNSILSKLEDASKENKDIILPTMGLVNNDKTEIPIVSENYIKE